MKISQIGYSILIFFIFLSSSQAIHCPQGSLVFQDRCVECQYIPGCAKYSESSSCEICQYGYHKENYGCDYNPNPNEHCCTDYDIHGNCIQCAPGLELNGNSCFKIQRPGCLYGQKFDCKNCAHGFYNKNGKCFRNIPYCKKYFSDGHCEVCERGYQVINGLCSKEIEIKVHPECLVKNQYGCITCNKGFHLTKQRSCQRNSIGCLKYFQGACEICLPNFKEENGQCEIDGCLEYGSYGCSKCSNQYKLKNGVCEIKNCLESRNGKCVVCNSKSRLANGKCVESEVDKCKLCASGFFVSQSGRCVKEIIGCAQYDFSGKCNSCHSIFVPYKGSCIIPGCATISKNGCTRCYPNFSLTSENTCKIDNCIKINYNENQCEQCNRNYYLQNGVCVSKNPLCKTYARIDEQNEVCSTCRDEYVLDANYNCISRKPGCVYQEGVCISCKYPFKRINQTCFIQGCINYGIDWCEECSAPYKVHKGNCVIQNCQIIQNGKCTYCDPGYHVYEGQCFEDDPKCATYYYNDCIECVQKHSLNKWRICVPSIENCKVIGKDGCDQCQTGYKEQNGICILIDRKCKHFSPHGCEECITGFHTENYKCISNDRICKKYSAPPSAFQFCESCIEDYFLNDYRVCEKGEPGCLYKNGVCSSCKEPFTYYEKQKSCRIRGCKKYNSDGCKRCLYPFKKEGDYCVINYCSAYNLDEQCIDCNEGYKLIQGQCYRKDPKCVDYTSDGSCKLCINQYEVFEGICVKEDKNCEKYSKKGGCRKCKNGYYISADKICLPQEPGCIYQRYECSYCNYPFEYDPVKKTCLIKGCLESTNSGCLQCKYPFQYDNGICEIPSCALEKDNCCRRCKEGYHLKEGLYCVKNEASCLKYNEDGDCQLCQKNYLLMSSGECEIAEPNCLEMKKSGKCLLCKDGYFLNRFYQCQLKDKNCVEYNNGICWKCNSRHFLYNFICFPYTEGCVKYDGKDCIKCRSTYTKRNGQCFKIDKPKLQLEGEDDKYDFEITPIDITKSKYYIDNLSPISLLGKVFYSSFYSLEYINPRLTGDSGVGKGWRAQHERSGEYIGYIIENGEATTFYAIQIERIDSYYIKTFYIEYSVDGIDFVQISELFDSSKCSEELITIYFTAIYAKAIRIVVKDYEGWPAGRIEFFYYDYLRFRKISSLKSLTYLKETIQSNYVDRVDNQMYINQRFFNFNPEQSCENKEVCFTGLELCQARTITSLRLQCSEGLVKKFYVTYSLDGKIFNCFEKCREFNVEKLPYTLELYKLLAKNVRVYPVEWEEVPKIQIFYEYE